MTFWAVFFALFGIIGLTAELYALATKERRQITASRFVWRILKLEDGSYDDLEIIVRGTLTILFGVISAAAIIHIFWGPCAFGIC